MEALTLVPPWIAIVGAALLIGILPRRLGFTLGGLTVAAVIPISLVVPAGAHVPVSFLGFEATFFLVDEFTRLLGIGFGILGTAAIWYAHASGLPRVTGSFVLGYIASTMGVIFAGDWLTLVFFWELMAVTSTLVVWAYGGDAVRAGYRYAIAHGIGGSLLLFAVTWHYVAVGSFAFEAATGFVAGGPAALAILGIGVNCAFIGLHTWLPDTYPRPHVATSVFLSVFTTKTSVYVLYRSLPDAWAPIANVEITLVIAYLGGFMAVYGVIFALLQHDMRALLSYHIQAQVGYMVAGIGIGTAIGVAGAMAHLFNNVMFKALLFMAVGVVILRTGENDLYRLGGLWREMPLTAVAFAVGALSITAIPGTNGFVSKGMLFDAADPAYHAPGPEYQALYWLLFLGAIGTLLSFIKLGYYVFLHGESHVTVADANLGQTVGMLSVGAVCVGFGLWWQGLVTLLPGGPALRAEGLITPFSVGHLTEALILVTISVITFAIIRGPLSGVGHVRDIDRWLNPLVFYSGKLTMLAITETYARVDQVVVRTIVTCYWVGNHPVLAARRLGVVGDASGEQARSSDGGQPNTIPIRASIGFSVLVITALVTLVLLVIL